MNKITSINGILLAAQDDFVGHIENETAHITEEERTEWNAKASINAKGILIATQEDLDKHTSNAAVHIQESERTAWNAKAESSEVNNKVNKEIFNAHAESAMVHVTAEDRARWNAGSSGGILGMVPSMFTQDDHGGGGFDGHVLSVGPGDYRAVMLRPVADCTFFTCAGCECVGCVDSVDLNGKSLPHVNIDVSQYFCFYTSEETSGGRYVYRLTSIAEVEGKQVCCVGLLIVDVTK